jgi:hypothetical protein
MQARKTKAEKAKLLKDLTTGKARLADLRDHEVQVWFFTDETASGKDGSGKAVELSKATYKAIIAEREKAEADPSYKPKHIEGAELVGYGVQILFDFG